MAGLSSLALGVGAVFFFFLLIRKVLKAGRNSTHPPLPPGPKGLPIVGNLLDLPKPGDYEAKHWIKHKDIYGPISSITVLGQTMVIVNDASIALDMLEKRAVKNSSRPHLLFGGEIVGWGHSLGLVRYGDRFRKHRKNIAMTIGSTMAAAQYKDLQEAEAGHFLLHILNNPQGLFGHIRKEAASVVLKMIYGYNVDQFKADHLVEAIEKAMDGFGQASVPGTFMVDIFPWMRYLPEWFPGTGWKQTAKEWREDLRVIVEKPFAFTKQQMASGRDTSSITCNLLGGDHDKKPEDEYLTKWTALSLYAGGADTTVSTVACFFLAMSLYPEVQRKAQAEIDQVVGQDRLPTFSDRPNLPYIEALLMELLRWQPVVPMSIPHMSSEEDIVNGYYIPKESVILPNIWYFTHDPKLYHLPMEFKPERFISTEGNTPEMDPNRFAFGFGRRICPGRVLADNALFITIVQALSALEISKAVIDGQVVEPKISLLGGIVSHPEPFETSVKPRSAHHEALIRAVEKTYPWERSDQGMLEKMEV
ncbi:cytochrome p450 oxidoreductase [Colletotrichum asianum]|uniref:Cytochrome p450 oxidoreductase n=1 Tax=Colletotrichum asianum TaxID=702518 RepID=A0A8H3ZMN2_9PEZI|nr:cytochrome p450 oxidoreductase [Colletotrichum asianum]